ncbi:MAG: phosphatase PAP2 family protein [Polyangiaceae bacterium]|jgi:membrane-associated phospholipid phosphatase
MVDDLRRPAGSPGRFAWARWLLAVGAVLCAGLRSAPAAAQGQVQTNALRWDPALDAAVTAGAAAAWIGSEVLKGDLAPSHCRWCSVDSMDAGVREALVWRDTGLADGLSNVTGFVLMPLAAVGLDALAAARDGALGRVPEDTLLIAEAGVVAADLTQLTKMLVGRERPFVHVLPPEDKTQTAQPSDNDLSFFSGHSAEAFALAAASGTVSTLRGYRWAPLTWSVGGVVAATTAYLRIAADKHWLTDVLVGAVVGAGTGFAIPFLFHSAVDERSPASASTMLSARLPPTGTVMTFAW